MDNQKIAKHPRATLCYPTLSRNSNRCAVTGPDRSKDIEFYCTPDGVGQLIGVNCLEKAEGRHLRALLCRARGHWVCHGHDSTSGEDSKLPLSIASTKCRPVCPESRSRAILKSTGSIRRWCSEHINECQRDLSPAVLPVEVCCSAGRGCRHGASHCQT